MQSFIFISEVIVFGIFLSPSNTKIELPLNMQNLIATKLGVHKITGVTLFDRREKKSYEPLQDLEVILHFPYLLILKNFVLQLWLD